jgi:hypothetical protein
MTGNMQERLRIWETTPEIKAKELSKNSAFHSPMYQNTLDISVSLRRNDKEKQQKMRPLPSICPSVYWRIILPRLSKYTALG